MEPKTLHELSLLPSNAYLDPEFFLTGYEGDKIHAEKRYNEGLAYGLGAYEFHISYRSVWSARMKDGSHVTSYETIGYHSYTSQFLAGVLKGAGHSGCLIIVHRDWNLPGTVINVCPANRAEAEKGSPDFLGGGNRLYMVLGQDGIDLENAVTMSEKH